MELDRKSLASFRVLVGMARADGELKPGELTALRVALDERADLLEALLAEQVDLDHELSLLDDSDRERLYQSAFAIAYADDAAQAFEVALLKKILPNAPESSLLGQVVGETLDTVLPGRILAEADPVKRDFEITEDIIKYSALSAVAGAMPVPGVAIVADLAVIALQTKMVHDIGQYWGHSMDGAAIRGFIGSVAGSAVVRIAVTNLARFVPGWGSVFGATTAFASTYAIGKAAQAWFAGGRDMTDSELKSLYEAARAEGKERFSEHRHRIDTAEVAHGKRIAELNEQLATGVIDRPTYDRLLGDLPTP